MEPAEVERRESDTVIDLGEDQLQFLKDLKAAQRECPALRYFVHILEGRKWAEVAPSVSGQTVSYLGQTVSYLGMFDLRSDGVLLRKTLYGSHPAVPESPCNTESVKIKRD